MWRKISGRVERASEKVDRERKSLRKGAMEAAICLPMDSSEDFEALDI
jgi:hypothetical protein